MKRATVVPALALCAIAGAVLVGCTTDDEPIATPTVTVTATTTVTETPAPVEPAADDPMTPLQAWGVCYGRSLIDLEGTPFVFLPYDPSEVTDNGDGTFFVSVGFESTDAGGRTSCEIGGTVGEPTVLYNGPEDFG